MVQEVRAGAARLAGKRLEILHGVPILPVNDEMLELAGHLIAEGAIPRRAAADAAHVAFATVYGCEYLLTWNCRRIANAELQRIMRRVVERYGYELPGLCTPLSDIRTKIACYTFRGARVTAYLKNGSRRKAAQQSKTRRLERPFEI